MRQPFAVVGTIIRTLRTPIGSPRRAGARARGAVLRVRLARMREDGNVRRRWAGLLRPPGEPWWVACLAVVVGVAVAFALYLVFDPGPHLAADALLVGVLLPALAFLVIAWLAVEMRSSVLGITAAATASGLALAAAWDATINGTGSTAALAILAAPPFMFVCGAGALVIERVARALADRFLDRAHPPGRASAERRRRRVGR